LLEEQTVKTPTVLVIFGASGDLTRRKLIPALADLVQKKYLGENFFVIGSSRTPYSDDEFRAQLKLGDNNHLSSEESHKFLNSVFYQPLDASCQDDFLKLKQKINLLLNTWYSKEEVNIIYYLSTAPDHFIPIAQNLELAGLIESDSNGHTKTRLVVEKPFGRDQGSGVALNLALRKVFSEEQIFRIDHYLGKETVQNILVMRFCNSVFEPLWNNRYVEQVQISVCEELGVENRGAYFDSTGITRDVIQNHVMQVLSLMCIEPPTNLRSADSIRDEKVKALRAIKKITPYEAANFSVCGQYEAGELNGRRCVGYREEKSIGKDSQTETYAALKLFINNWRWAGVPFYIRAGKRLPKRITEISVWFKSFPDIVYPKNSDINLSQNVLSIQVQPQEGISLRINNKLPGQNFSISATDLDFTYASSFATSSPDAYERLLLDAIKGDATLFTRDDEIEEAWAVLDPFIEGWQLKNGHIFSYKAGTWGPDKANSLLAEQCHFWREL
jgi:glucose-6-phosphate 1-dehydrogenase